MAEERAYTKCDHCGKWDQDPKWVWSEETNHHDCVSASRVEQMEALASMEIPEGDWSDDAVEMFESARRIARHGLRIRDHALDGTRGKELLATINRVYEEETQ